MIPSALPRRMVRDLAVKLEAIAVRVGDVAWERDDVRFAQRTAHLAEQIEDAGSDLAALTDLQAQGAPLEPVPPDPRGFVTFLVALLATFVVLGVMECLARGAGAQPLSLAAGFVLGVAWLLGGRTAVDAASRWARRD